MKLKLLVFPLTLIVTTAVSIGYIYPIFSEIFAGRKTLVEKRESLADLKSRRENVKSLLASLNANDDDYRFVLEYFPQRISEERVINWLYENSLDKSLALINVNFKTPKKDAAQSTASAYAETRSELRGGSPDQYMAAGAATLPGTGLSGGVPEAKIQADLATAEIRLTGKYEKIEQFINSLQKTDQMSGVSALSLKHVEEQKKDGEEKKEVSDILEADMSISLNFAPQIVLNGSYSSSIFKERSFNFSKLREFRSNLSKLPEIDETVAGERSNPFLP